LGELTLLLKGIIFFIFFGVVKDAIGELFAISPKPKFFETVFSFLKR